MGIFKFVQKENSEKSRGLTFIHSCHIECDNVLQFFRVTRSKVWLLQNNFERALINRQLERVNNTLVVQKKIQKITIPQM